MKSFILIASLYFMVPVCPAQDFDGFVVTKDDSLFRGYMYLSPDVHGRKVTITNDKHKKPRIFYLKDLRYYAYKSDTFAILKTFYPYEGEEYLAENTEGKGIIMKGRLWLYKVSLARYNYGNVIRHGDGTMMLASNDLETFVIEDRDGNLYGVKPNRKEFHKFLEVVLADAPDLLERIRKRELKFRDMKEIISLYNAGKK